MRNGTKKIFHLEAWAVKVMSLYKVESKPDRFSGRILIMVTASTLCTTLTWRTSIRWITAYIIVLLVLFFYMPLGTATEPNNFN